MSAGQSDKDDSGPASYAWSDSGGSEGEGEGEGEGEEASGGEAAAVATAARAGGGGLDFTMRALQRAEASAQAKPAAGKHTTSPPVVYGAFRFHLFIINVTK